MTDHIPNIYDLNNLPVVRTPLSPAAAVEALEARARRGKLAGFTRGEGRGLFSITDFGAPFEYVLNAEAEGIAPAENAGVETGGTKLRFLVRMKPLMPAIFVVALVTSVWPGVWLTDSLLRTYFTGYDFQTWMWYLPLTAPFCPWAYWTAIKRSRGSAAAELAEVIPALTEELRGTVLPPSKPTSPGASPVTASR